MHKFKILNKLWKIRGALRCKFGIFTFTLYFTYPLQNVWTFTLTPYRWEQRSSVISGMQIKVVVLIPVKPLKKQHLLRHFFFISLQILLKRSKIKKKNKLICDHNFCKVINHWLKLHNCDSNTRGIIIYALHDTWLRSPWDNDLHIFWDKLQQIKTPKNK